MDFPGGRRSESLTSLTTNPLWSHIFLLFSILKFMVFPGGSDSKESSCNAGDLDSILGSGKSPGEGNGNPLQYSCLENPMDRQVWWATVCGVGHDWATSLHFMTTYGGFIVKLKLGLHGWKSTGALWEAFWVAQMVKNLPATRETQVQSLGQENPLEKGMATHSRILAWRIPWTEEPGKGCKESDSTKGLTVLLLRIQYI